MRQSRLIRDARPPAGKRHGMLNGAARALLAGLLAVHAASFAQEAPTAAAAAEDTGKQLYQEFCLVCHGAKGQGSTLGPALTASALRAASDSDIARVVSEGRAAQGMPMFGRSLEREEIGAIVGFVRTLQNVSTEAESSKDEGEPPIDVTGGDARRGQELFRGADKVNCAHCHTTFFWGGSIGPDLSDVARQRSHADIYEAVAEPSKKVLRDYRAKKLVLQDGTEVRGMFRNDTPESVQILNADGNLWTTYLKKDIKSEETLRKESLMPEGLLGKLNEAETKDLFAYLFSLE